jgi:protein O-GlcNAc transferase
MPTVAEVLEEGLAHHRAGRWGDARRVYRRVLAFDGGQADALHLLGMLEFEAGQLDLAEALLLQATWAAPANPLVWGNLARTNRRRGKVSEAGAALRKCLALAPAEAGAWAEAGFGGFGAEAFGRALALDPASVDALNNRATFEHGRGRSAAALRLLRRALALQPAGGGLWQNFGLVLRGVDRLIRAISAFRRATSVDPTNRTSWEAEGWTRHLAGDAGGAAAAYRRVLALDPDDREVHASLILTLNCLDEAGAEDILAAQRAWDARFARPLGAAVAHDNAASPDRRLRVGYVAVEGFRAHTAAVTLLPLIEAHDRDQVEIVCYSDVATDRADGVTRRFRDLAGLWRDTAGLDDAALAARIRADGIDILADVYGYPPGSRLLALARRPAPVQVNLLPMGSFGMDAVPWMIGDARLTPPGSESWFSETVLRLPRAFCYRPLVPAVPPGPGPMLRGGPPTFGSFNQPAKLSDRCLALWGRVLAACPGARLILKGMAYGDPETAATLNRRAWAAGLDPDRLELRGWAGSGADHFAAYGEIDIALDPMPYGGVITTCEALSLGVPVVSRAGDRLLGRYGATLLDGVGLSDLVSESDADYVEIAVRLAADPGRLADLRATLPDRFAASEICDGSAYARAVESAYRVMWQAWCAGR